MVELAKGKILWVSAASFAAAAFLFGTVIWATFLGGPELPFWELVTFALIGIGAAATGWGWYQAARYTKATPEGMEVWRLGRGLRILRWADVAAADRLINQCFFVDREGEGHGVFLWYFQDPEAFVKLARQGFPAEAKLKGF